MKIKKDNKTRNAQKMLPNYGEVILRIAHQEKAVHKNLIEIYALMMKTAREQM